MIGLVTKAISSEKELQGSEWSVCWAMQESNRGSKVCATAESVIPVPSRFAKKTVDTPLPDGAQPQDGYNQPAGKGEMRYAGAGAGCFVAGPPGLRGNGAACDCSCSLLDLRVLSITQGRQTERLFCTAVALVYSEPPRRQKGEAVPSVNGTASGQTCNLISYRMWRQGSIFQHVYASQNLIIILDTCYIRFWRAPQFSLII